MAKATAKIVPKTNKMADTILAILEVKFFMIVFPINPIRGYTTIISHISILVNTFFARKRYCCGVAPRKRKQAFFLLGFYRRTRVFFVLGIGLVFCGNNGKIEV